MMQRPVTHGCTAAAADWPPIIISYSDQGTMRRLDLRRQDRVMGLLSATAMELDIHPWEFLAGEIHLRGTARPTAAAGTIYPPVARACRELLVTRRDVVPQVTANFRITHIHLTNRYRSGIGPNMGSQIFVDDDGGRDIGDLPLSRLLSHGRDRITAALVEHMTHGDTWAATVLARIGDAA